MSDKFTCNLCGTEGTINDFYSVCSGGTTTYECVQEDDCKELRKDFEKKKLDKLKKDYENGVSKDYLKTLSKEELFNLKYNYKFNELEVFPIRARDGCIHYVHPDSNQMFTWSMFRGDWKVTEEKSENSLRNMANIKKEKENIKTGLYYYDNIIDD